jgi:cytochrome c553
MSDDGGTEGGSVFSLPPPPPPPADDAGGDASALQCTIDGLPLNLPLGPLGSTGTTIPGACALSGAVHSVLTAIDSAGNMVANQVLVGVLPVDMAISPDGQSVAVALPGDAYVNNLPTVLVLSPCGNLAKSELTLSGAANASQPIAVAYEPSGKLLVQTRNPAQLWTVESGITSSITLSTVSRHDTGHDVFHTQAGGMIACASCHPEGRDDGHVWTLDGQARRTPSLDGTIAGTAPYHWQGDMKDMNALVDNVYTIRMSGAQLASDQMSALTRWVQSRPAPPAPSWVDTAAAARGKVLFNQVSVGCAGCHSGAKFTDNTTRDVGSGGAFQVPPLVGVGWRTPLLHDGCAKTIADRFGTCESTKHGNINALSQSNIADLSMYLESL